MASTSPELPGDVLRTIFDRIPRPDVLAAAAVSRAWRDSAVLHPAYYRPWSYVFDPNSSDNSAMITGLEDVLCHAEKLRYRLNLAVIVQRSSGQSDAPLPSPDVNACALFNSKAVPLLRRAVPLLVGLDVVVEPVLAPVLWSALSVPAPHLRSLKVRLAYGFSVENGRMPVLPEDLFACSAPLLVTADFNGATLFWTPAPCLTNVRTLDVGFDYEPGHLAAVARCFPRVENLRIQRMSSTGTPSIPLTSRDLASFGSLRSLYLGPLTAFNEVSAALRACALRISHIEICSEDIGVNLAPILGQPAPETLELHENVVIDLWVPLDGDTYHRQLRAQLSSASTMRCVDSNDGPWALFRILGLSGVAATLTDISLDDQFVRSLLRACPALPTLERLIVVLVSWAHLTPLTHDEPDPGEPRTPPPAACPRLTTLTLHATQPRAVVPAAALHELARAFGAPHLVLANGGVAGVDVRAVFASVRHSVTGFEETEHAQRARRVRACDAANGPERGTSQQCVYILPPLPPGSRLPAVPGGDKLSIL